MRHDDITGIVTGLIEAGIARLHAWPGNEVEA